MEHDFVYTNFLTRTRNGLSIMRWIIGLAYMAINLSFIAWYINFHEYLYFFVCIYSIYKNIMFISVYINHSYTNTPFSPYTSIYIPIPIYIDRNPADLDEFISLLHNTHRYTFYLLIIYMNCIYISPLTSTCLPVCLIRISILLFLQFATINFYLGVIYRKADAFSSENTGILKMGLRCESYYMHCRRTYAINSLSINGVTVNSRTYAINSLSINGVTVNSVSYANNNNNNYLNCYYYYYYYYNYYDFETK